MDIGDEWWGIYIGIIPMAGLFLLFFKGIQRQVNKRAPSLPFLAACWIIAYASFGGINAILSLVLDFYDIRRTSRYFVAIATIGLIYFAFVINRLMRNGSLTTKLSALGGAGFACHDGPILP